MKKYTYGDGTMPEGEYYAAAEVDELLVEKSNDYGHEQAMRREAERRIEQLERALKSVGIALELQRDAMAKWTPIANEAIDEGVRALMVK